MLRNSIVLILTCIVLQSYGQDQKMGTIFNGVDFENWVVPKDNIWWSIQKDGLLVAKSDPEQTGSILWSHEHYTDFVVQLDFKMGEGTVDSGIFMRGDDEKNVQIQIGESGSLKRDMTASPYVPNLGYPVEAEGVKELLDMHGWNTIKATAQGDMYRVWLNGKEVMQYRLENANLEGPIGLQLHPGRDMAIYFKNIMVGKL